MKRRERAPAAFVVCLISILPVSFNFENSLLYSTRFSVSRRVRIHFFPFLFIYQRFCGRPRGRLAFFRHFQKEFEIKQMRKDKGLMTDSSRLHNRMNESTDLHRRRGHGVEIDCTAIVSRSI